MPPKKGGKADQAAAAAAPTPTADKKGAKGGGTNSGSAAAAGAAAGAPGAPGAPAKEAWFPKSKRAVLKNGGIVGARPDRTVGEWVVKEWQRLPKQLLQEHLQREKRPRALYPSAQCSNPNRTRVRVVLPDPKGKADKDISLVPKQDYATRLEAEEYAALLALRHLMPTLPLERKFPEPFATAWTSFGKVLHEEATPAAAAAAAAPAAAAASGGASSSSSSAATATPAPVQSLAPVASSMFASQADRARAEEERRKRDNARENRIENKERKYATVFMSESNRNFVHDILRHLQQQHSVGAQGIDDENEQDEEDGDAPEASQSPQPAAAAGSAAAAATPAAASASSAADSALISQLEKLGFARSDAQQAQRQSGGGSDLNAALDYLMLNLPEHRLPKQFDPRGKQLEVVLHEKDQLSVFLGPGRMAVPRAVCEAALDAAKADIQAALMDVFGQLYAAVRPAGLSATVDGAAGRTQAEVDESVEEEMMALESIFDKDYTRISTRAWSVKIASDAAGLEHVALEFLVPAGCAYPFECPVVVVRCDHLSAAQRLQLAGQVARHIYAAELLGNPLTFEVHSWLTAELDTLLRAPNLTLPKHWQSKQKMLSDEDKQHLNASAAASASAASAASAAAAASSSTATTATNSSASSEASWDGDDASSIRSGESAASGSFKPRPPHNDAAASQQLSKAWDTQKATRPYQDMLRIRQTLPVYKQKDRIADACRKSQVVVCSGATGSGKSTQLPQFLLDMSLEGAAGAGCNILVTQPRRISAIGLAERVAEERGERCGQSVGYRIRGESKVSAHTRLTFVTTGVLLRQLTSRTALAKISHIVIDEVHERSVEIDFLLLILKQLLPSYPWLKLVLMSATLDAEVFSNYFGGAKRCPVLTVEGRTFPVAQYYLEDILQDLEYAPDHKVRVSLKADELEEKMNDIRSKLQGPYDQSTLHSLATIDIHKIDYRLIERLVWWIIDNKPIGGILIFLPGVYEITKLCGNLERSSQSRETRERYWIIPLHGSLSSSNQQKVFSNAPSNTRKTNIAETSITVNDILYVIDSGRMKQTEYDADKKMSSLVETFVSQAAANQRKGRAGRVSEGTCYRLFSSVVWSDVLPSHQLPELHRSALDHVCLQIKLLGLDKQYAKDGLQKILGQCVQPPSPAAVASAIDTLKEAQALDADERLTPLGAHLARLPIDNVKIGKLLLYSAMLGCVTAMTRCAAVLSGKSIFLSPFESRDEADRKKMSFANGKSDALTMLRAFQAWIDVKEQQGNRAATDFAKNSFLSLSGLETALQLADSYYKGLEEIGFAAPLRRGRGGGGGGGGGGNDGDAEWRRLQDDQSEQSAVLSAVLTASLYPNVLAVDAPSDVYAKVANGAVAVEQDSKLFKFFQRGRDGNRERVFLHPRSVNFKTQSFESPWLVYLSMQHTDRTYVHDTAVAMPYPLMLFGRSLDTDLEKGIVVVDKWIHFKCPPRIAALIRALKLHLNATLEAKIQNPSLDIRASPVISAILRIITTNGF